MLVEIDGWDEALRANSTMARRLRVRFRRAVRGAVFRHAGEVVSEEGGRCACLFPTPLDAALAATHTRSVLKGSRGVPARIVVHAPGAAQTAAIAVARDLTGPGDVLVLGEAGAWMAEHAEVEVRSLGRFLMAGVPGPVRVSVLESTGPDPEPVEMWATPWMARLIRLGLVEPRQK